MKAIHQGRLWAIRNNPDGAIFHAAQDDGRGGPTLFTRRGDADLAQKRIKEELDYTVQIVEVAIVEMTPEITR